MPFLTSYEGQPALSIGTVWLLPWTTTSLKQWPKPLSDSTNAASSTGPTDS